MRWILLFLVMLLGGGEGAQAQSPRPKNLILMIADGCGPASITMARDYARAVLGRDELALDAIQTGAVRTGSASSRVTDSAAGATAYACGVKTYNGAIAVDTAGRPLATLLEAAKARGMATGLVATSRITHATPAAFAAHVPQRAMESEIAAQMLAQRVDVLLGGGWSYFLPTAEGGRRQDGRNLLREAEAMGYQVVRTAADFRRGVRRPVLGLFGPDHLPYEIDRDPEEVPSLAEMTRAALELLADDPDGFFLMVEGSRIDHAGHANDAAAHVREVLAYDEAVAVVLDFARRDGQTLVVSVADHETGGLSLGRPRRLRLAPGRAGPRAGFLRTAYPGTAPFGATRLAPAGLAWPRQPACRRAGARSAGHGRARYLGRGGYRADRSPGRGGLDLEWPHRCGRQSVRLRTRRRTAGGQLRE